MKRCRASQCHCPSTAATHIGSSCACSGRQSPFSLVLVTALHQSKAAVVSHPQTNHTIVSRCGGDVAVRPTNGHLVLITRLLSLSKIKFGQL